MLQRKLDSAHQERNQAEHERHRLEKDYASLQSQVDRHKERIEQLQAEVMQERERHQEAQELARYHQEQSQALMEVLRRGDGTGEEMEGGGYS
ncbi:hypothetical protein HH1059_20390 [Halorhodospira halochloris]|uniref:Uncharacterized protein n=1 Tax=Halorhodospira halochloris TaxID=1052 RepID=A0A0X8XB04_HALHR|nr:hypothetical protein [Halorhodospira halochloris]MBK1651910.1 hypothetical protein [Halorhodospira halochloris]BAU58747.1 hypothetical protein HH1059_20390 [Halorhodospira halochloris]